MTKKVDVWMPFLIDKYLGDTTDLTTEQHGAYMLLLLTMWKRDGKLPCTDSQLAAIAKLSPARWRTHKPILMQFFKPAGDHLTQKRLTIELVRAKKTSQSKSDAGKKGAEARYGQDGDGGESDGSADGRGDGTATGSMDGKTGSTATGSELANGQQAGQQTGTPIPIPSSLRSEQDPPAARVPPWSPPAWVPLPQWQAFVAMRKAKGKRAPFTDAARDGIVSALAKLQAAGHDVSEVLQESVNHGWSSVYAPKAPPAGKSPPNDLGDMFSRGRA